jgi:thioredoxin-related protein
LKKGKKIYEEPLNMKNALTIILFVFVLHGFLNPAQTEKKPLPQEKTKTLRIGVTTWNTEQVDFKEILEKAKKEKKMVLAIFNDARYPLWKRLQKKMFANEEIMHIAREAVLYYVEANHPKGKELAEKYKVFQYPTFKLFSAEGKLLHTNYFGITTEAEARDLVNWVYEIKQGRGPKPRQDTVTIGHVKWYTEQYSFDQILTVAKKQKKPVLLVHTDYSNQRFHTKVKDILASESFRSFANRAVLLNVEQTAPAFFDYMKKFELRFSPTAILFTRDGKVLERDSKSFRSAETFCNWFNEVVSGESRAALAEKAENQPENRENLMKLARKMSNYEGYDVLDILRRIIQLNPDIYDPLTQEAYEQLVDFLYARVRFMTPEEKKKFIGLYNEDFMNAYYNYYPDHFKYRLYDDRKKYHYVLTWLNAGGKYKEAVGYFKDFANNLGDAPDAKPLLRSFKTINQGVFMLLNLGREGEAEMWMEKIIAAAQEMETGSPKESKTRRPYNFMTVNVYNSFVKYYAKIGELSRAEFYANKVLQIIGTMEEGAKMIESLKYRFARQSGVFADLFIQQLNSQLEEADKSGRIPILCEKAIVLAKAGKKDEAESILREVVQNPLEGVKNPARMLGYIADRILDSDIIIDETVELAKKAVSIEPAAESYWILARVYAAKGEFREAVKNVENAVKLAARDRGKKRYRRKLNLWKLFLQQ